MTIDAIQSDVSTEDDFLSVDATQTEKRELTEREKMLNDIARQNAEAEGREYPAQELEGAPSTVDEGLSIAPKPKTEAELLAELGYYRKEDGNLYTKMKIQGEEREVPASQVKAYQQKDIAGDWKLQEAAEERKRLQEGWQALEQERNAQLQKSLSQPSVTDADAVKDKARGFLAKLMGQDPSEYDDVDTVEALASLIGQPATVNTDALLDAAEQRVLTKLERERQAEHLTNWTKSVSEGERALKASHPEVYSDPVLFNMVNTRTAEMVQAQSNGDPDYINLAPADIIAKAAVEVQDWLNSRTNPKPSGNQRQQRKEGLKPMPQGLGTVNQRQKQPVLDTSPTAAIERMKQSRAVN